MDFSKWNSLEVAKLLSGLLTPIVLAIVGIYIQRLTIYDDMAPMFNDLLCYFTFVGGWRDFSPPSIVGFKRTLDKKIHITAPLFANEFNDACKEFQILCFRTFNAPGKDATLRTNLAQRQAAWIGEWKPEWAEHFSNDISETKDIREAYKRVMAAFASDIGVNP